MPRKIYVDGEEIEVGCFAEMDDDLIEAVRVEAKSRNIPFAIYLRHFEHLYSKVILEFGQQAFQVARTYVFGCNNSEQIRNLLKSLSKQFHHRPAYLRDCTEEPRLSAGIDFKDQSAVNFPAEMLTQRNETDYFATQLQIQVRKLKEIIAGLDA